MCRHKAAPAAARRARDRRRADQLGGKVSSEATPDTLALQAVYSGQTCLGFIYSRGKLGVEAFDCDTRSLGLYPDLKTAAAAVARAARGAS
jgi:hypothetical protein